MVKKITIDWNSLSDEDKKPWVDKYLKEKADLVKNPEYRLIKSSKKNKQTPNNHFDNEFIKLKNTVTDLMDKVHKLDK